jgi:hypothetical protein
MSTKHTQRIRRKLSTKRQLSIPADFTENVEAYLIEETEANDGDTPILTLHPITEDTEVSNDED